ncbi:MAG: hypothetical protein M1812_000605 [Candelaria pacifica]|nr:MAG: hypothetical protein M1812_000605 [Candelaria pacifica]
MDPSNTGLGRSSSTSHSEVGSGEDTQYTSLEFQYAGHATALHFVQDQDGKLRCFDRPGKRYTAIDSLKQHHIDKHVHNGFTCWLCSGTFTRPSVVKKHYASCVHRKSYTGSKPWNFHSSCPKKQARTVGAERQKKVDYFTAFERRQAMSIPAWAPRSIKDYREHEWIESTEHIKACVQDYAKFPVRVIKDFNFKATLLKPNMKVATSLEEAVRIVMAIKETKDSDAIVKSNDGEILAVFMKNGLQRVWPKEKAEHIIPKTLEAFATFGDHCPPPPPTDMRHTLFHELRNEGKLSGVHHLALAWLPRRGPQEDDILKGAVPSRDITGKKIKSESKRAIYQARVKEFFRDTTPMRQTLGILHEIIDPRSYKRYTENYDGFVRRRPCPDLDTTKREGWLTAAVLYNQQAEPHKNTKDIPDGFVADFALGDFTGGDLVVKVLREKYHLNDGNVLFLRSAICEHWLTEFEGNRIAYVAFSQKLIGDTFTAESGAPEEDEVRRAMGIAISA